MSLDKIKDTLDYALNNGTKPYALHPSLDKASTTARRLLSSHVSARDEIIKFVTEELNSYPELALFNGGHILYTGGIFKVSLEQLAHWLLAQSLLNGIDEAVKRLDKFVSLDGTPSVDIMVLCGIRVPEEIPITDDISIVPFSDTPHHFHKDFIESDIWSDVELDSALVLKSSHKPKMKKTVDENQDIPLSQEGRLEDICRCLTLFGPSPVVGYVLWSQIEDWVPLAYSGEISSAVIHEILPKKSVSVNLSPEEVSGIVSGYSSLSGKTKNRIDLGINRINLALRRQQQVDKAIELRIALEALLAYDRKDTPIASIIRLRGSRFMSDNYKDRKAIYDLLRDAYDLGSKAVHGVYRYERGNEQILDGAIEFCAKLIKLIIRRGNFPDSEEWVNILLG